MATPTKPSPLKKNDRVIVTTDLRGVPEGTPGKLKMVNGLGPWIRGWVEFDNGVWVGSVSTEQLVREDDWDDYKERRIREAEEASQRAEEAAAAPAPDEAAAAGDGAASGPASKVPAHLLARS